MFKLTNYISIDPGGKPMMLIVQRVGHRPHPRVGPAWHAGMLGKRGEQELTPRWLQMRGEVSNLRVKSRSEFLGQIYDTDRHSR